MYCDGNVRLTLRAHNSLAGLRIGLRGQFRMPDGEIKPFSHALEPSADRASNLAGFDVARGDLLSLAVFANSGAPKRGQSFVQVGLSRGDEARGEHVALLISDYLENNSMLGWPGGTLRSSLDGRGCIRSITGTNPAAGVEISETVPTNAQWQLLNMVATLVASGAAATRRANLVFDDGANVYFFNTVGTTQTAGQTQRHSTTRGHPQNGIAGINVNWHVSPTECLAAGHRIRTITDSLQAGDDWGAPQLLVEEWIAA